MFEAEEYLLEVMGKRLKHLRRSKYLSVEQLSFGLRNSQARFLVG
jgi:hypothetical protein